MKNKLLILIIVFLFLLNIGPLIFIDVGPNISYTYDFYSHATGANQIIQDNAISFENDNRMFWGGNTELFYPPGFMIFLAIISLIINVGVLYLPLIIIIQWIIYVILVYIIAKQFFKEDKYVYLSVISSLMFITGTRFLGFAYLLPPILGCVFIWAILFVFTDDKLSELKKIILNAILISIILLTHRPSTIALILALFSLTLTTLIINNRSLKKIGGLWLSTILALDLSTVIFYIKIFNSSVATKYFYNISIPVDVITKLIYPILAAVTIIGVIMYNIISKYDLKIIKEEQARLSKKWFFSIIGISIGFFILIASPLIKYLILNYKEVLSNPLFFIFNVWTVVVDQYRYLRPFLYIFHIGVLAVILFIPSIFLFRKYKEKVLLLIMPLLMIILTFLVYTILNFTDERPERIYIYIIPYMIVGSVITIKYIFENFSKSYKTIIIIILIINLGISSFVNIANAHPWLEKKEYDSFYWISNNIEKKDIVLAQGYYAQPGRSFDINTAGFYRYNPYTIRNLLFETEDIYVLNSIQKQRAKILDMEQEMKTNNDKYNIYYSNNDQIIAQIIN
jgi:hypothetical protein